MQNAPSAPDPWKAGSSNSSVGKEGRKLNENKLLSKKNRCGCAAMQQVPRKCDGAQRLLSAL
eukprot:350856-Chlamydomonas_euryale.AAC.8